MWKFAPGLLGNSKRALSHDSDLRTKKTAQCSGRVSMTDAFVYRGVITS